MCSLPYSVPCTLSALAIAEKVFSLPHDYLHFLTIAAANEFISGNQIRFRVHIFAMKPFHIECFNFGVVLLPLIRVPQCVHFAGLRRWLPDRMLIHGLISRSTQLPHVHFMDAGPFP